jgi:hypothetical protein
MKERRSLKRDSSNGRETLNNKVKDLLNKDKNKSYWSINKNKNSSSHFYNTACKNSLVCYTDLIRNEFKDLKEYKDFNSGMFSHTQSSSSLAPSKKVRDKDRVTNIKRNLYTAMNKTLFKKYHSSKTDYEVGLIENLIYNKNCHIVSTFKEFMILDYTDEFLRRWYTRVESKERIPKFANYYKNYLKFFCNPIFRSLKVNGIVQLYGDNKAELYYNRNYAKKKKNDKKSESLQDDLKVIFHTTIKDNIEKNEMTQQSDEHMSTVITFNKNEETPSHQKLTIKGRTSYKEIFVESHEIHSAEKDNDTHMEDFDWEILAQKSFLDRSVKRGNEESIANMLSGFETIRKEPSIKIGRKIGYNKEKLDNIINKKTAGKIKANNFVESENIGGNKTRSHSNFNGNMIPNQTNYNITSSTNNLSPFSVLLKKETKIKDVKDILNDSIKESKRDPLKELKEVKLAIKELRDLREKNEHKENKEQKENKDDYIRTKKETNNRDSQINSTTNINQNLNNFNSNVCQNNGINLNNNNVIQSYTNKEISKLKSATVTKSNASNNNVKARKIEEFKALKLSKPTNFNSNDMNKKFLPEEKGWKTKDSTYTNNNKSNNFTATTQNHMHSPSGSLHSINDIMKITLSVYMDKSNRLRSNSNLIGNAGLNLGNTGINTLTTQTSNNNLPLYNNAAGNALHNRHSSPKSPNFKGSTPTTIINKVDNYNNFNININNPVNINEEIESILSRNIKDTFNRKDFKTSSTELNSNLKVILEKNKTLSRNKNPSLYKITVGAKSSEDETFQGSTGNNLNLQNNLNNYHNIQNLQSKLPIKVYNSYGNHPCKTFLI